MKNTKIKNKNMDERLIIPQKSQGVELAADILSEKMDTSKAEHQSLNMLYSEMNNNFHKWSQNYSREEVDFAYHNHGAYAELLDNDVTDITGHYVSLHFDVQNIPIETYVLNVCDYVNEPKKFTLNEIKAFPKITLPCVLECAASGGSSSFPRFNSHSPWGMQAVSQSSWSGCLVSDIISACGGYKYGAKELIFTGSDTGVVNGKVVQYQMSLNIENDDILDDSFVAYEMNGQPIPLKHGFPVRLICPGYYGQYSVKYLTQIQVISSPFRGPFMKSYTHSIHPEDNNLIQPVTIIRPRALIKPPGLAEFFTRNRYLQAGIIDLEGRCWVGGSTIRRQKYIVDIAQVNLSFDHGQTWHSAQIVQHRASLWGWSKWTYKWTAKPGLYTIIIRATDTSAYEQPLYQSISSWNYHSLASNIAQRLTVHVVDNLNTESIQASEQTRNPQPLDHKF